MEYRGWVEYLGGRLQKFRGVFCVVCVTYSSSIRGRPNPGHQDEDEQRQLLGAAWKLARQSGRGGRKSLLDRVRDLHAGHGWRHVEEGAALSRG